MLYNFTSLETEQHADFLKMMLKDKDFDFRTLTSGSLS